MIYLAVAREGVIKAFPSNGSSKVTAFFNFKTEAMEKPCCVLLSSFLPLPLISQNPTILFAAFATLLYVVKDIYQ